MMELRLPSRSVCIRSVLAIVVGALMGFVVSLPDIHQMVRDGSEVQQLPARRRSLPESWKPPPIMRKPGPVNPNDGLIIVPTPKPEPAKPLVKPKQPPFQLDTSKLGKIVNPHGFHYTIDPKESCQDKDIFLVAYIHTAPDHTLRRDVIRATWAKQSNIKGVNFRVFFIVGRIGTAELQNTLEKEAKTYKDIVQESYMDAYHNLSIKAVGAMQWVTSRCKSAKFILKTDDDVFVNLFALVAHLKSLDKYNVNNTQLLMCLVWTGMHVLREGKWAIPESVIPDVFYPHYCSGMAYIMTPDAAQAIFRGSEYVPFFWVDDVYITGLIPKAIGLQHVDIGRLMFGRKEVEWLLSGDDWYKYLFCHLRDTDFYQKMWGKLLSRATQEPIPEMNEIIAGKIAIKYGHKKPPDAFIKAMDKKRKEEAKAQKAAKPK